MRQTGTINGIFLLLAAFNLLISFGAIWSLQRIGPEIRRIYQRNVVSLGACEEMLLAMAPEKIAETKAKQAKEKTALAAKKKEAKAAVRKALAAEKAKKAGWAK